MTEPVCAALRLDEEILNSGTGSVPCGFRSKSGGNLFALRDNGGAGLELYIVGPSLVYEVTIPDRWSEPEAEDVRSLDDGRRHNAVITASSAGTHLYLDGYQVLCGTTMTFPKDLPGLTQTVVRQGDSPGVTAPTVYPQVLTSRETPTLSKRAEPLIKVAASRPSPHDVTHFADVRHGSFWLCFQMWGWMQQRALLAAGEHGREQLTVPVGSERVTYTVMSTTGERRQVRATGAWSDGGWHEAVVSVGHGAADLYVDDFRKMHAPGKSSLAGVEGLDEVVVSQNYKGVRPPGEVQRAGLYDYVLSDAQIKRLSEVEPVETDVLFDRGHRGSTSYRIPSLLTLPSSTVLAGADQRVPNVNDSPNDINLIVHRPLDEGRSWESANTIIDCSGIGEDASSVIDSCMVQGPSTERVYVLIDHFPGGIGQPSCWASTGFDEHGRWQFRDLNDGRYVVEPDGAVTTIEGQSTKLRVLGDGTVLRDGSPAGNTELAPKTGPAEALLTIPTNYLQVAYSNDDGLMWSQPWDLNSELKQQWMRLLGTCPGNDIVLRNDPHAKRLIVPFYFNNDQS